MPLSPICYLLSAFARLGFLGHIPGTGGGANERDRPLRNRRFPRIALSGREADAVQRGGRGSHIHILS